MSLTALAGAFIGSGDLLSREQGRNIILATSVITLTVAIILAQFAASFGAITLFGSIGLISAIVYKATDEVPQPVVRMQPHDIVAHHI